MTKRCKSMYIVLNRHAGGFHLFGGPDILGFQKFKAIDFNNGHVSVQFLFGFFVVVLSAGQTNTDAVWDIADTFAPYELVQRSVQANVGRAHGLLCELLDFTDGARGLLLKPQTVQALVQVDGVVTRDYVLGEFSVTFCLGHSAKSKGEAVQK